MQSDHRPVTTTLFSLSFFFLSICSRNQKCRMASSSNFKYFPKDRRWQVSPLSDIDLDGGSCSPAPRDCLTSLKGQMTVRLTGYNLFARMLASVDLLVRMGRRCFLSGLVESNSSMLSLLGVWLRARSRVSKLANFFGRSLLLFSSLTQSCWVSRSLMSAWLSPLLSILLVLPLNLSRKLLPFFASSMQYNYQYPTTQIQASADNGKPSNVSGL